MTSQPASMLIVVVAIALGTAACQREDFKGVVEQPQRPSAPASDAAPAAESPATDEGGVNIQITARNVNPQDREVSSLPSEHAYLQGDALSGTVAAQSFRAPPEVFDKAIEALRNEAARDNEATQQTRAYRDAIEAQFANSGGRLRLQNFVCGLSVCLGSLRTSDSEGYNAWAKQMFDSGQPPHYSFTDGRFPLGGDVYEYRFLFSTDPAVNRISGRS